MKKTIPFLCGLIVVALSVFWTVGVHAQTRTITGKVTDAESGAPLKGVRIIVKGTKAGAIADTKGEYRINIPADGTILVFSYIGFTTREITIGDKSTINTTLDLDIKSLEDVVVTALGVERQKKSLGYAVQEVNSSEIMRSGETNIVAAL